MKKVGILILVLVLASAGGLLVYHYSVIPKEERVCKFKTVKAKPSNRPPFNAVFIAKTVSVSHQKPDSILDLPSESVSESPLYFTYEFHGADCPGVIYRGEKQWTIFADTNLNGKLSDEKRIKGIAQKASRSRTDYIFGPVLFKPPSCPAMPAVYFVYSGFTNVTLYPAYYQTGKIRLGNTVYQIGLLDGDYDGKYTTLFSPRTDDNFCIDSDVFAIDLNHDRFYNGWYYQTLRETLPLSRYFRNNDIIYEIHISEQADKLELRPSRPSAGKLKIGSGKSLYCHLYSKTLSSSANFFDEVDLPAGDYCAHGGILEIEDSAGAVWKFIEGTLQENGPLQEFTILPDKTHEVSLGPPFVIRTSVYKIQDTITIRPRLQGQGGETFSAHVYKNGNSQPEPIVKILDENGTVMHNGTMEYG